MTQATIVGSEALEKALTELKGVLRTEEQVNAQIDAQKADVATCESIVNELT